jgi:LysM repeat protein
VARKSYGSYGSSSLSSKHRRRNIQWFILALVVLIILLSILLKDGKNDEDSNGGIMPGDIKVKEPPKPIPPKPQPIEPEPKPIEPKPLPAGPLSEAGKLMKDAFADIQQSDYISAREKLNEVLKIEITPEERARVKNVLTELSVIWLSSKVALPGDELSGSYLVQGGDRLEVIGKRHHVPAEFLMKINGIKDATKLREGQNLKVVNGPFNAIIYKSRFEMDLYLQNTYVKTYKIGIGKVGKDTPTGRWRVQSGGKLIRPPWPRPQDQGGGLVQPEDPDYPLGSRWIGLDGIDGNAKGRTGFGIHGTKDPESIGTRSSLGCVRLYNGEVIKVYDMMTPGMSEIHIRD